MNELQQVIGADNVKLDAEADLRSQHEECRQHFYQ